MDDILIHGISQEEHDGRVRKVLQRLQEAGLTLNEKCEFSRPSMRFLGHIISASGLTVDPAKTAAIRDFPAPSSVPDLQRFLAEMAASHFLQVQVKSQVISLQVQVKSQVISVQGQVKSQVIWSDIKSSQVTSHLVKTQVKSQVSLSKYKSSRTLFLPLPS